MLTSEKGIALIKSFEGCAKRRPDGLLQAYPDPGSGGAPWTIGWGTTGRHITKGTVWTQEQADKALQDLVDRFGLDVTSALRGAKTTQNQYDAMVSFAYNLGVEKFRASTLLKKHLAGDFKGAAAEFVKWNKASGKVLRGLTRRREAEAALYSS